MSFQLLDLILERADGNAVTRQHRSLTPHTMHSLLDSSQLRQLRDRIHD